MEHNTAYAALALFMSAGFLGCSAPPPPTPAPPPPPAATVDVPATVRAAVAATQAAMPSPTAVPTQTPVLTNTPMPPTMTPVPTVMPLPTATSEPKSVVSPSAPAAVGTPLFATRGNGPTIVAITGWTGEAAIARYSHAGTGRFEIEIFDKTNKRVDFILSERGIISGTKPAGWYQAIQPSNFQVEADGMWTLEILPLSAAKRLAPGSLVSSSGDDVFVVTADLGSVEAEFSKRGFELKVWSEPARARYENIVSEWQFKDEVGKTVKIVPAGTKYISVLSRGPWSLKFSPR